MEQKETAKCSLCGGDTGIEVSGTVAEWYLCDDCVSTDAAREAGFTHEEVEQ